MPNLVGILSYDLPEEQVQDVVTKQLQRVRIANISYRDSMAVFPGFGMGLQDHEILENGEQPVHSDDGRYVMLLDGEISNAHELKRQFRSKLSESNLSDPKLCLELLLLQGDNALRLINGLFCLILYDRHARCLKVCTDRFGFRPFFYVLREKTLIFGSEIKALCVVDRETRQVDDLGVLSLFAFGSHIMERTWLKGYLRLSPATILSMNEHGLQTMKYWNYQYNEHAKPLDQSTYVTMSRVLIDRAVERSMKGSKSIGIFLSGGYDSRVIAAAMRPYHLPVPAFTFGYEESRDVQYAAMLAERLGLISYALGERAPYLSKYCSSIVWRTEGMLSFYNTTSIRYHPFIKSLVDIVIVGFLGEFWGSHTWPQLLLARSRESTIEAVFKRILRGSVQHVAEVFRPSFFKKAFNELYEEFSLSFESVMNDHPLNVADCWQFLFCQPRSAFHSTSVDRYNFETRAPLMDFELVEFLLQIPPTARLEQRIYKKTIAYGFPAVRDIPCSNSGLPVNPHFLQEYFLMTLRFVGRSAVERFSRFLGVKGSLGREFRNPDEELRSEPELISKVLQPLIRGGIFPDQIFDYEKIEKLLNEHLQGNTHQYQTIFLLITLGIAFKFFLYDDIESARPDMFAA